MDTDSVMGPVKVNGAAFSKDVKQYLAQSKPGDRIMIEAIKAKDANGKIVHPESLLFSIK